MHSLGLDVTRMSAELDTYEMLLWAYEHTPCSYCREGAVEKIVERYKPPEWLLEECLYDCSENTRKLAEAQL